jgi:serine/threonine-protein kinase RsbW
MEMRLQLTLPRDTSGIPVARRVLRTALLSLGLERGCADDIEIAMSEACANVLLHVGVEDAFQVSASIDRDQCLLEVADQGPGFKPGAPPASPDPEAEHGRGLLLMHSLMDGLDFETPPEGGTVARLRKRLVWERPPVPDQERARAWREAPLSSVQQAQ